MLLVQGDCLDAVMYLHRDEDGVTHAPCPTCGEESTTARDLQGNKPRFEVADGVAYGQAWLVPCGHKVGQIEIHPDDIARWDEDDPDRAASTGNPTEDDQ